MENPRFLECLAADFGRLREVVAGNLNAPVPTCPGWEMADLARHVGEVYVHKTIAMREGAEPSTWPPEGLADEEPLTLLDRSYSDLVAEFAAREPEDQAGTWYGPDQTVGFWIRRMAQETVIHRIDAELAAGQPVAPVPDDLAVDGVDELLKVFLAYSVATWPDYFTEILASSPGHGYSLQTAGTGWTVRTALGAVSVEDGAEDGAGSQSGAGAAEVEVSGPPEAMLRWVWNRELPGEPSEVAVKGSTEAVELLRRSVVVATQ